MPPGAIPKDLPPVSENGPSHSAYFSSRQTALVLIRPPWYSIGESETQRADHPIIPKSRTRDIHDRQYARGEIRRQVYELMRKTPSLWEATKGLRSEGKRQI